MLRVNHILLKAPDPQKTAQWCVDVFGATVVERGTGLGGSSTVRLDIGGTRFNVTSAAPGETLAAGTTESHYGLEHCCLDTDGIETAMAHVLAHGAEVLLPVTQTPRGSKFSYIKGPDNVQIELVQPPA